MANLTPYVNFDGNTQEAMEFYHSIFGGEYTRASFADFGALPADHEHANKTMHSQIIAGGGEIRIMAADYIEGFSPKVTFGNNVTLAIAGSEEELLTGWFNLLADGGQILQPLEAAPWGDMYGALTDKFGTYWQFNVELPKA